MDSQRTILVTGGSGKAGRAVIRDLLDHGYRVINADLVDAREPLCPFVRADLTDFGQCVDVLGGVDDRVRDTVDGVVHLAAIPASGLRTNAVTFRENMLSTYNVFEAARRLKIRNIVWASSETVLGLPFETPPVYVPIDEDAPPRPESAYSLSKLLGEVAAEQFCRWDPELKIIGLRFSNIMETHDYVKFPEYDLDATKRKWNLWGYIDAGDAAQAVRKSLEAKLTGAHVYIIANPDTVMFRPNDELLEEVFPGVPRKREFGAHETLLAIEKARRELGYEPQFGWRLQ